MNERSHRPASEIDSLLKEIAADPSAVLLRNAGRARFLDGEDLDPPISPRMAGLTHAERHLLRVYREDLAELFLAATNEAFLSDERNAPTFSAFDGHDRAIPRIAREALLEGAHALQDGIDREDLHPQVRGVFDAIRGGIGRKRPSAKQLSLAALRVLPTDSARNLLVQALRLERSWRPASRIIGSILQRSPSSLARARALIARGHFQLILGDLSAALDSFGAAMRETAFVGLAAMNALTTALRLGRGDGCSEAARVIDDELESHPEVVQSFAEGIQRQRQMGLLKVQLPELGLTDPSRVPYGRLSLEVVRALAR